MALHCLCGDRYPAGTMLCAVDGPAKASADTFSIRVYGTGCHGAMPETGVDVINILCHIQNNLQTIVSREISCFAPAVLSICHIDAGSAANILPEEGMMEGTIRTFDEAVRQKIQTAPFGDCRRHSGSVRRPGRSALRRLPRRNHQ